MDVKFNNLAYVHLLWAVPLLFGVVAYGFARRRRSLEKFATENLIPGLTAQCSRTRQWTRSVLVLAALVSLVLAIIDPRWGRYYENIPRRGIDILFVLDVSRSMTAADVAPNRLERAKQYIGDVLDVAAGDRVGLVTFAGTPVLKCPLTINYGAFKMLLDDIDVRSSPRGGSLIGDAIRLAADSFVDKVKDHKAVVVITDGDDQESYPVEAAKEAFTNKGVRIYTVGIGNEVEGSRVPDKTGQGLYMKYSGQEVWSRMNPTILRDTALAGGGAYIPAGTKNVELGKLLYEDRIAQADRREFEATSVERRHVRFQWFAGLALLLLVIETLVSEQRPASVERQV